MLLRFFARSNHFVHFRPYSTRAQLVDTCQTGSREQYGDIYVLRDGRAIRFEIADENDDELLIEHYIDGFLKHTSFVQALKVTKEDLRNDMYELIRRTLPSRGTLLGFHEDKLACFRLVQYVRHDEIADAYGPLSKPGDPAPVPAFPDDYGTLVDAIPSNNFPARALSVFFNVLEHQLGKFLPFDVKNVAFGEAICVRQEFQKHGLGTHISALSEKLAVENNCNYIANVTIASASSRIAAKKGFKVLYSIPYDKFLVHGKPVFHNLKDGSTSANMNLGKLA